MTYPGYQFQRLVSTEGGTEKGGVGMGMSCKEITSRILFDQKSQKKSYLLNVIRRALEEHTPHFLPDP